LQLEPKFIFGGGKVGHIEDVSVKARYQRKGIGFILVTHPTALMGPYYRFGNSIQDGLKSASGTESSI